MTGKRRRDETETVKAICDWLDLKHILKVRVNPIRLAGKQGELVAVRSTHVPKGCADILVFPGNGSSDIALEVKSFTGRLSDDQILFQQAWERSGRRYRVVRPDDWLVVLETTLRER